VTPLAMRRRHREGRSTLPLGPALLVSVGLLAAVDLPPRPYKKVARAQAQARTQEALLDAATEEFFEGDWPTASLESLAAKAGVTKQTLLRNFGSKDGLLLSALASAGMQARDQRWDAPVGDIAGIVENLLEHYEAWGERSMRLGAWQNGPPLLALISQGARQFHYDWIEYAFAPQLDDLSGKARARRRATLIALCDVQTWWIWSHDLGLPRAEVHRLLTGLIEHAISHEQ
jgi:AcrR family transcriptional regulator